MKTVSEAISAVMAYDNHRWTYELAEDEHGKTILVVGGYDARLAKLVADNQAIKYDRVIII